MTRLDTRKATANSVLKVSWLLATALFRQLSARVNDRLARDLSR